MIIFAGKNTSSALYTLLAIGGIALVLGAIISEIKQQNAPPAPKEIQDITKSSLSKQFSCKPENIALELKGFYDDDKYAGTATITNGNGTTQTIDVRVRNELHSRVWVKWKYPQDNWEN